MTDNFLFAGISRQTENYLCVPCVSVVITVFGQVRLWLKMSNPHFHVTAGLVWKDGKLLITKRPEGSHLAGYWEFPGGKQEPGESLEVCLEREIREELGMGVKAVQELVQISHDYETKSITLHLFNCTWLTGTPTPIGCDELRWVRPEELAEYRLPPPDLQLLPMIQELAGSASEHSKGRTKGRVGDLE